MKQWIKRKVQTLLEKERDPARLSRSIAAGVGMALSPYYMIQTWLLFPVCWMISANAAVSITVLWAVNNGWTTIPLIVLDYYVGHIIFEWWLEWNLVAYNPGFMDWFNAKYTPYITPYLGIEDFCLWCFVLGGTLVGVIAGIASYWLLFPLIRRRLARYQAASSQEH